MSETGSKMQENPLSCDTFVVLPSHTKEGVMIFGKNSDRPYGEVQEVVYYQPRISAPGAELQATYITIPEIEKTHAVALSKPSWMWGAEMGANDVGVVIGNEAVFTKLQSHTDLEEKLLGMDLLRLGLERSESAEHAVNIITELLEKYGQGGPCSDTDTDFTYHNSFLIADANEAWVLETADQLWVAEKVTEGYRSISNSLSISTKISKMSSNLKVICIQKKLWDGKREFSFKDILSDGCDCSRYTSGKKLLEKKTSSRSFTLNDMISILRDKPSGINREYTDTFPTAGSQVSIIKKNSLHLSCHWFTGTPDPSISVFKPFVFTNSNVPCTNTESPQFNPDPAKILLRFTYQVDRAHKLYESHRDMVQQGKMVKIMAQKLRSLEETLITRTESLLREYKEEKDIKIINNIFNEAVSKELELYS